METAVDSSSWTLPCDWTDMSGTELASDWAYTGKAGLPVTLDQSTTEGRKILRNSASRTHRLLSADELENGKQARWLELEVHGKLHFIYLILLFVSRSGSKSQQSLRASTPHGSLR
jgi:hypothetical protein